MKKFSAKLALGIGAAALLSGAFVAGAAAEKVTICHFTGSETNLYEVISVSANAWYDDSSHGHAGHGDFELPDSGICEAAPE